MLNLSQQLQKIIQYFDSHKNVSLVVQEGSFAKQQYMDKYSDLDLNIWFSNEMDFTNDLTWLKELGEVLVAVPLDFPVQDGMRSLIVIFENGVKVDFSFWPIEFLEQPFPYYDAYLILLDKANRISLLRCVFDFAGVTQMDEKAFQTLVDEFYLEMHYVAKFQKRGEFWFVAALKAGIRENYFLPLLEQIAILEGKSPSFLGRHMNDWLSPFWLNKIQLLFKENDSKEVFALFSELYQEIAKKMDFQFDQKRLKKLEHLILGL
ncbi:hypothetical protein KKC_00025 [Listeria fleischmannii subsp. coloradonensis]|uniref:aminoglycoside 6-adenylyltransferase n=1 Tax=Listeria fleischmannii TaxID=1069827 RepID=UPI000254FAB7|nr:aminoglycoside 6-adenylyltransferase [Listeria fleischmannii]EIA21612.1 hypothetical protein KKC_00025 [Listeria fleischmannii subsp. coloradonensis]